MDKILHIEELGFPWKTRDPFIFCAYHYDDFPEGDGKMQIKEEYKKGRQIGNDFRILNGWRMYHGQSAPGFPYHPHRGFETVTINKKGVVDHSDSLGAAGRFMSGDVQWMTAGKGVLHSEMFPLVNADKRNPLEIFQIWLNLPSYNKMVDPHFKMLWAEDIPEIVLGSDDKLTKIQIITGSLLGKEGISPTPHSWAADPENRVGIYTVEMSPGATWTLPPTDPEAVRDLYFYSGDKVEIDGVNIEKYAVISVHSEAELDIINGEKNGKMLVLEGKPIAEPVAQHGPFVMNTRAEIMQAFEEYQRTQFGGWPWNVQEKMHDPSKGRFALYADGTEETP